MERGDKSAVPQLREQLVAQNDEPRIVISTLRTLDGLGALTSSDVRPFISHFDAAVRVHALQLSERWLPTDVPTLDATLAAAASETNPRVALQFALSLGEARDPRAFAMLATYARAKLGVRRMDAALLSSLHGRGGKMLAEVLHEPTASAPVLDKLAGTVGARRDNGELARTLTTSRHSHEPCQKPRERETPTTRQPRRLPRARRSGGQHCARRLPRRSGAGGNFHTDGPR